MAKETPRKIDTYIDALFQALPAPDYDEIRLRMQRELKTRLTPGTVAGVICHLRKHVDEYGFTVPYVGKHMDDGEQRFFAVLVEKDGSFTFDQDHARFFDNGSHHTMQTIATQAKNLAVMIDVRKQYERSRARKDYLEDVQESVLFVAKRTARICKAIEIEIEKEKAA